ncbi:MAG: hypothetical protein RLZZ126_1905 [Pseudomonadota bacterium]
MLLGPTDTASALPYTELADATAALLADPGVSVPERQVLPLAGGGSLFVMPALDGQIAIAKIITFTPTNAGTSRPSIQGDVLVFDTTTGERRLVLHGPTVTARRTAAVSLLAARLLAPNPSGPMLIVGAGEQGQSHVEAFAQGLKVKEFWVHSRSRASALRLVRHAQSLGAQAWVCDDADAALAHCSLVATCTPAQGVVLSGMPRTDAFITAVGAFTPDMVELGTDLCQHVHSLGLIVTDTPRATDEAGDLLQAGLTVVGMPCLADVVHGTCQAPKHGPVLFKSCGWAGWDLAAARVALKPSAG